MVKEKEDETLFFKGPPELTRAAGGENLACLVIISGQPLGKVFMIGKGESLLGRTSGADISIDDPMISRKHAVLKQEKSDFLIHDMKSKNGLFVNYGKVRDAVLKDGDKILVGHTILKFLQRDDLEIAFHEELYSLASRDGLTELMNKKVFLETLQKEISRVLRHKSSLSLAMFDIDHFKNLNDLLGHHIGDFILKEMARVIRENLRTEDTLGRYGGEEFIALLPDTGLEQAYSVAGKIRTVVEKHVFEFEEMPIKVMVSAGVAEWQEAYSLDELIVRVDEKLYEAKLGGRNQVCM